MCGLALRLQPVFSLDQYLLMILKNNLRAKVPRCIGYQKYFYQRAGTVLGLEELPMLFSVFLSLFPR